MLEFEKWISWAKGILRKRYCSRPKHYMDKRSGHYYFFSGKSHFRGYQVNHHPHILFRWLGPGEPSSSYFYHYKTLACNMHTRWTIILMSFSDNKNQPNISITSEYVLVRCIFYIFLATPTTQKGKKAFATIPLPEHPVGISMCSMSRFFPFLEVNSELQLEGRQHWPLKRKKSLYQNAQYSDVQHEQIFTFAWNTDMSELRIVACRDGWQRWRQKYLCDNPFSIGLRSEIWVSIKFAVASFLQLHQM